MRNKWLQLIRKLHNAKAEEKEITLKAKDIKLLISTIDRMESLIKNLLSDTEEMSNKIIELLYFKNIIQMYIAEFHPRTFDTYLSSMCDETEQEVITKYLDLKIK